MKKVAVSMKFVIAGGTLLQPIRSCLKVLDRLFCDQKSIVTSFVVADNQIIEQSTVSGVFTTVRKIIGTQLISIIFIFFNNILPILIVGTYLCKCPNILDIIHVCNHILYR